MTINKNVIIGAVGAVLIVAGLMTWTVRRALVKKAITTQAITTNPAKAGAMYSTDGTGNAGTWKAMSGSGAPYTGGTPAPSGLMVSTDGTGNPGTWVPVSTSSFGGGGTGNPGQFALYGAGNALAGTGDLTDSSGNISIPNGTLTAGASTITIAQQLIRMSFGRQYNIQDDANQWYIQDGGTGLVPIRIYSASDLVGIGNNTQNPTWPLSAADNKWGVDANGTLHQAAAAPTASTGTITGTNAGGKVASLSSATTVTITFANSGWTTWSSCTASTSAASNAVQVSAISVTAVTFTFTSLTGTLYYQCNGN